MLRSGLLAASAVALVLVLSLPAPPAEAKGNPPMLWGGELDEPIVPDLAPILSVAGVIDPPADPGEPYWLKSEWWPNAISDLGLDSREPHENYRPEQTVARYYPEVSAVVLLGDGREHWVRVEDDLDAMLRRYIALAEAGAISSRPSPLELMSAARDVLGEDIELRVNGEAISAEDAERFWVHAPAMAATYRDVFPVDLGQRGRTFNEHGMGHPGIGVGHDYWVTFTLPEGRRFEYHYMRDYRLLIRWVAGWPAYPGYEVSPAAHAALERIAGDGPVEPASAALLSGAGLGGLLALAALVAIVARAPRLSNARP